MKKKIICIGIISMFLLTGLVALSGVGRGITKDVENDNLRSNNAPEPELYVWPDHRSAPFRGSAPGPINFGTNDVYIRNMGDVGSTLDWTATVTGTEESGTWQIQILDGEWSSSLSGSLYKEDIYSSPQAQLSIRVKDLTRGFNICRGTITITGNGQSETVTLSAEEGTRSKSLPAIIPFFNRLQNHPNLFALLRNLIKL